MLTKEEIKQIFLDNGFKIKAGETDLKSYVYNAAHALLKQHTARQNKMSTSSEQLKDDPNLVQDLEQGITEVISLI